MVLNPGFIFYESGIYIYQLKSILHDFDLNIINQIPETMRWMVTHKYHSTFPHPETQLIGLTTLYSLEFFLRSLLEFFGISTDFDLKYALTSYLMNLLCILVCLHYVKKIFRLIGESFSEILSFIFICSTPLFYFSFLQVNIIEIFALPFVTYIFYELFLLRVKNNIENKFLLSFCVGILLITKLTYLPLLAYLFLVLMIHQYKLGFKKIAALFVLPIILILAHFTNNYIKSEIFWFITPSLASFFNSDISDVVQNFMTSTLFQGGVFFNSPALLIGLIGLICFLKNNKILNYWDKVLILLWLVYIFGSQSFLIGYKTEDHWPGRINLAAWPILLLGWVYFWNQIKLKSFIKNTLFIVLVGWHIILNYGYILTIQISSFTYAKDIIPNNQSLYQGQSLYQEVILKNFIHYKSHLILILFYSLILTLAFVFLEKIMRRLQKMNTPSSLSWSSIACFSLVSHFIVITFLNLFFSPKNVHQMKEKSFFNNLVVARGVESYYLELVAQYVKTSLLRSDSRTEIRLKKSFNQYQNIVKGQVLVFTDSFKQALQNQDLNFYYWNKIEIEKEESLKK